MDFAGKRVLVTGSSRGIGFAVAEAFINAGARVAINGRTEKSVNVAMERLGRGERLVASPGDIGTVSGYELAVETAQDAFEGLDILVNSAGIGAGAMELWSRTIPSLLDIWRGNYVPKVPPAWLRRWWRGCAAAESIRR